MRIAAAFVVLLSFALPGRAGNPTPESAAIVAAFQKAASSPDAHVRAAAARALCDLGADSAQQQLFLLLKDKDDIVSAAAAEALAKCGDKTATKILLDLLATESATTNADGLVVASSATALLQFADMKAEERTVVTIRALGRSHDPAVAPAIIQELAHPRIGVQIAGAIALGRLKDRAAGKPLTAILETYYRTTQPTGAVIASDTTPANLQQLKDANAYRRSAIVWALGEIRDPAAKPILQRAIDDDNSLVRDAAKEAVEKLE